MDVFTDADTDADANTDADQTISLHESVKVINAKKNSLTFI